MAESNNISTLNFVAQAIADGDISGLTVEQVSEILGRYPYFTLPASLLCKDKRDLDEKTRRTLAEAVACNAPNPDRLYMLVEPGNDRHAGFYPDEAPQTPTTESAIDTFLSTYGTTTPEEEALLNKLIFNPTPDYSQILAKEEEESIPEPSDAVPGSDDDLINRFIIEQKQQASAANRPMPIPQETVDNRHSDDSPAPATDDSLLSESLARIFIKQRQYQRAFEIIGQLNLKYPEKSVYFADQLRFLQKLIANQDLRNRKKQ